MILSEEEDSVGMFVGCAALTLFGMVSVVVLLVAIACGLTFGAVSGLCFFGAYLCVVFLLALAGGCGLRGER